MTHPLRRFVRRYHRWFFVLAAIGVLAMVLFVYLLLVVQTGTPVPVVLSEDMAAGTPEFRATLVSVTNSPQGMGQSAQLLNNGDEFRPDLLREIDAATSTITFSTYIWKEGTFSREVLGALTRAASRGVTVRLLLDGLSGKAPEDALAVFTAAGGKVGVFHPLLYDPLHADNRTHRRVIVMDHRVGYIGGIAIADTWLGNGLSEDEWRDSMTKVHGTMAQSLESGFSDEWLTTTGEILVVPALPSRAAQATQNPSASSTVPYVYIPGSAGDQNRPIGAAFLLTALSAQKSLYITNPYVLPDAALREVLIRKAQQGVDVRLLVPGPETDGPLVRWASQHYYQQLLDSGVRIYEYQPSLIHEKAMVADGVWSLVGSANIDNRSAELNDENLLGITDAAFAGTLIDTFYADLQHSVEISPEAWRNRNPLHRFRAWTTSIPFKQF